MPFATTHQWCLVLRVPQRSNMAWFEPCCLSFHTHRMRAFFPQRKKGKSQTKICNTKGNITTHMLQVIPYLPKMGLIYGSRRESVQSTVHTAEAQASLVLMLKQIICICTHMVLCTIPTRRLGHQTAKLSNLFCTAPRAFSLSPRDHRKTRRSWALPSQLGLEAFDG